MASDARTQIHEEQAHVDRVYRRLETVTANAHLLADEGRARSHLGHYGGLVERDMLVHDAARRLRTLSREHDGLVFGRIDLTTGEVRYVGRLGVLDETFEPLVIDWRAPAAAPFYRATPADPMGVVRRRVIRCSGQRVVGVEDDLLDPDAAGPDLPMVGDGALLSALTRSRGPRMRDIVATIQREQDAAIRAPSKGVTQITGGPGTGKTVVALHRAAYLLYQERRRFESTGVLVVGPSPVFIRYIERVLPSLGEDTAVLRSLGAVLDGVTADERDEPAAAAVKGGLRMRTVLRRAAGLPPAGAPTRLRLFRGGQVLSVDEPRLVALRRQVLGRGRKYNSTRRAATEALLGELAGQVDRPRGLGGAGLAEELCERPEVGDFLDAWWPVLTPQQVLRQLADRDLLARCARGVLSADEVGLLAATWESGRRWSVADVALLDELRAMLGEPPVPPPRPEPEVAELTTVAEREYAVRPRRQRGGNDAYYGHLVVDEAQDLSPMQWRMLGRRGRHASWTVVGDAAQSSWPDAAEAARARDDAVGRQERHAFRLTTNYRNSAEVFDLAARVVRRAVPDADLPDAVRTTGQPPVHELVPADGLPDAVRAGVDALAAVVEGTIGVITPSGADREVRGWLDAASDGVQVVDAIEAKGMEYDAVVVVRPERLVEQWGVPVLYVALTRATQRLVTVSTDHSWLPGR